MLLTGATGYIMDHWVRWRSQKKGQVWCRVRNQELCFRQIKFEMSINQGSRQGEWASIQVQGEDRDEATLSTVFSIQMIFIWSDGARCAPGIPATQEAETTEGSKVQDQSNKVRCYKKERRKEGRKDLKVMEVDEITNGEKYRWGPITMFLSH
jgi:ribosomal protein L21